MSYDPTIRLSTAVTSGVDGAWCCAQTIKGDRCRRRAGADGYCPTHRDATALVWETVQERSPFNGKAERILEAADIDFAYGHLQVLFAASLEVRSGEALALLGTNGAGKSTLLRVICGLECPSSGRVTFDGSDITGVPAENLARHGLTLIPGGRALFRDMTVDENLDMQVLPVRKDRDKVRERREVVLSTFPKLAQRLSQQAGTLSGGEQQQLALAKALLLNPKVLCIDELSLGLAPVVVSELLEMVTHIHATGVTLILVEQSLNIAAHLCDRAVFLEKGQVRFEGKISDLLERDDIARAVFLGAPSS